MKLCPKEIPVQILGTYINSQTPLSCRCNKCGLVWEIRPNNLLRGYGCPKCGIEKRAQSQSKDNTDFVTEIGKINPQITIQPPGLARWLKSLKAEGVLIVHAK